MPRRDRTRAGGGVRLGCDYPPPTWSHRAWLDRQNRPWWRKLNDWLYGR